ncbi:hypothetical protein BV22DRAFT_1106424 [Leucogyrophana mollusca]|uniref:Uncharacterized protein n=1 Tax=Leucogyrophana mollusca TaxID=85980 RepID=A0ACB8BAG0_9AGAM|nr:hypothetical protein BV22DRAFT_1106424 [Leucogyrophana mollusca]
MSFLASILSTVFLLLQFGHSIHIKKIRPFSLSGFRYTHNSSLLISASHVQLTFHFPRPSNPRWATFQAFDYEYKDSIHHVSLRKVTATLWLLPLYFKFTGGSWVSVELGDFRLRVFKSSVTPDWVQRMRRNLVATILTGDILRVDDFVVKLALTPLTGAPDGYDGDVEMPEQESKEDVDEIRISVLVDYFQTKNWQDRMYTFENIQAQFRRSWVGDRGSYVMIAEGSRWTKVQALLQRDDAVSSRWWRSLLYSIISLPFDIVNIYKDPMSTVDLHIPRLDVTFDDFRIRDAELLRQSTMLFIERVKTSGVDVSSIFFDALAASIFS